MFLSWLCMENEGQGELLFRWPMSEEEPRGGETVADLLSAADVALLLLFISTSSQLLLCQDHLLLHVGDLLLCPPTVFLNTNPQHMRKDTEAMKVARDVHRDLLLFSCKLINQFFSSTRSCHNRKIKEPP